MKNKKWLYVIYPSAFVVVGALLVAILWQSLFEEAVALWNAIWVSGVPSYQYSENSMSGDTSMEPNELQEALAVGTQYGELSCESIELQCPLYYGDGEEQLKKGIGTYIGGGLPGSKENCILGGHDTVFFADLDRLKEGDIITTDTICGTYVYQVAKQEVIEVENQTQWLQNLKEGQLVLYTCYPIGETDESRSRRYMVVCDLQEAP